jgi:hypothetical protein
MAAADDELAGRSDPVARYVESFLARGKLQAENALTAGEIERLRRLADGPSSSPAILMQLRSLDAPIRQSLASAAGEATRPPIADLKSASEELGIQIRLMKNAWQEARSALEKDRALLFEVRGSRTAAGQWALLLSIDNRQFWLCGLVAVGALVILILHDRRIEFRRALSGGHARSMRLSRFLTIAGFMLLAAIVAAIFAGQRVYEAMLTAGAGEEAPPRQTLQAATERLEEEVADLDRSHRELEGRREEAEAVLTKKYEDVLEGTATAEQWHVFRVQALKIGVQCAVANQLAEVMAADQAELDRVRAELQSQTAATTGHLRMRKWIRGGLGLVLTGTVALGGLLFRRSVLQRRRRYANTCPLCLGNLGLKTEANHRPARGSTELIHCGNLISRAPRVACGYSFRQAYRPMTKLCFPTLGVPKAGKTHWLTMLYWQLNRGNYPRAVQFEKIQAAHSGGADDFDALIEQILYSRMGTAATQRDRVPLPVVFNFRDRDPWGCSNLLVNVFDYSGEVTSDMGVEDYRRRRALEADGFVFFLDPTFPPEPQAKALADFREDLRLVKGVRTGKRMRLPIALCLTKIDLLAAQSFALADGRDAVAQFYAEMAQVDPSGEAMTLAVIEARSRLVSRLHETIWPGWEIERTIRDLFGSRHLFFPLTPVGLDGRGEADLSLRTIAPFGLLEPLLWLLEMNGYKVLE